MMRFHFGLGALACAACTGLVAYVFARAAHVTGYAGIDAAAHTGVIAGMAVLCGFFALYCLLASYLPEMPRNTVNESGKHETPNP